MQILKLILQLCTFKASPSGLPYSRSALYVILALLFLLNQPFPEEGMIKIPVNAEGDIATVSIWNFELALLMSFILAILSIYLFLKVQNKGVRTLKTLLGYYAVELVFLILIIMMKQTGIIPIIVFLMLWKFAAQCFVIKESLSTQVVVGVLLAINLEIIKFIPFMFLFAPILTQAGGAS